MRRLAGVEQQNGHPARLAAAVLALVAIAAPLVTPPAGVSRQAMAANAENGEPAARVAPGTTAEWPGDTNTIESLTPEQARKLAEEFPGVEVEFEIKLGLESIKALPPGCLPLIGLKSLDAETARALAGYTKGPLLLNGLTTLDAETATALAGFKGEWLYLNGLTTLDADTAKALATTNRPLSLPNLKKISPKALSALVEKRNVEIPLVERLELIPDPDGGVNDDFVIPEWLEARQKQQRAKEAPK